MALVLAPKPIEFIHVQNDYDTFKYFKLSNDVYAFYMMRIIQVFLVALVSCKKKCRLRASNYHISLITCNMLMTSNQWRLHLKLVQKV